MANNTKVKRGFYKLPTNAHTTKTTTTKTMLTKIYNNNIVAPKTTTFQIRKYNKSNRNDCISPSTICYVKSKNNNNEGKSKRNCNNKYFNNSNNKTNNKDSSGISCSGKSSISGITHCCPSLKSLFYFSCKSPNSIITFITKTSATTIGSCISEIYNLYCCCWWSWLQRQPNKIKNKTFNNSFTAAATKFSASSSLSSIFSKRTKICTTRTNTITTTSTASSSSHSNNIKFCSSLKLYFFLWLFLSILAPCISLTMTEVRIPKHIMRYETATLGCKYDLDGESLYSVKWYKDGFEFYRYVPRDMPPGQVFPLPGVDVDLQNSTDNVVVLNRVTLQSTGRYRCEVSGEAPSFQTVSGHEDMIVVVTPLKGPQITGGQPRYSIGEKVSVNCTSAPSKPICHLSWLINGVHANRSYLRYYEPKIVGREGLEVATLGLEFRVRG
ncbi:uncharacterized protein ACRADG_005188 [Cochliomyia hominivorax]